MITYYKSFEFSDIKNWKIICISIAITFIIYCIIPLLDKLTIKDPFLEINKINTIEYSKITPLKKKIIKEKTVSQKKLPKLKKINKSYQPLPINVSLDLNPNPENYDYSISFDIKPMINEMSFIFKVDEVDVPPMPIIQIKPQYPFIAKSRGIEGKVILAFVVNKEGKVEQIEVIEAKNGDFFIDSAINAVKKWKFKPGENSGKPVSVKVSLPLNFQISN